MSKSGIPIKAFGIALALAIAGGSAVLSCSSQSLPAQPLPNDAKSDGQVPKPPDGGRDARRDTEPDYDANPWDGSVDLPGIWEPISGLPASCGARIAKDPKVSVRPFPWRACVSGRAGCEVFFADWGVPEEFLFELNLFDGLFEDENGVHISYHRTIKTRGQYLAVVQRLHADVDLAIVGTVDENSCTALKVAASRTGYATTIAQTGAAAREAGVAIQTWAAWSPIQAPNSLTVRRITDDLAPFIIVQGLSRGDGFMAFEQTAGGGIFTSAFRFADQTLVKATPNYTLETERPLPSVGGYFALVATNPSTVDFMPLEGGHRTVVQPLPGNDVVGLKLDRANNDALVWMEKARAGGSIILYTAPFTTDGATLQRRAVARLPTDYDGVANAGVFVYAYSVTGARVVRLSDGMAWELTGETEAPFVGSMWVNNTDVWFATTNTLTGPGAGLIVGMVRLPRPTGAPTVPSGL